MAADEELLRIFRMTENKGGPASEQTLRDLVGALNARKNQEKENTRATNDNTDAQDDNTEATESNTLGLRSFGNAIIRTGRNIRRLTTASADLVGEFADVGNSVTAATRTLGNIPVVGDVLSRVLSVITSNAEQVANSFVQASQSGATFGGSVLELSRSASMAGMTLDQFSSLIQSNGEALLGFGDTTESGARRFAQLSRQLIETNDGLYNLGFSTQGINEGLLNYSRLLRIQGIQQGRSDQELLQGTNNYLKSLDALAKVTGQQRDALVQEQERIASQAQFQAALEGTSADVRQSFNALITQMPTDELKNLAMDILATGTISQDQNHILASQFPDVVAALTRSRQNIVANEALSLRQRQEIDNVLIRESDRVAKALAPVAGATAELFPVMTSATAGQRRQIGALEAAEIAQRESAERGDNFNQVLQNAQQEVARMGNFFQIALAQSGLLPFALDAFVMLGNIVASTVLPLFQMFGSVLQSAFNVLDQNFVPIVATATTAFLALGGAAALATLAQKALAVATAGAAGMVALLSAPVMAVIGAVALLAAGFQQLYNTGWTFGDVLAGLSDAISMISAKFSLDFANLGAALMQNLIIPFRGITDSIGFFFDKMMLNLADAFDRLKNSLFMLSDEDLAARQAERKAARDDIDKIAEIKKKQQENRVAQIDNEKKVRQDNYKATVQEINQRRADREAERQARGEERATKGGFLSNLFGINGSQGATAQLEALRQQEIDVRKGMIPTEEEVNYSDPIALLKSEAERRGVADEFGAVKTASTNTPANPQPEPQEQAESTGGPQNETGTVAAKPVQETSADPAGQLNTHIMELVRLMRINNELTRKEISATEGLSGDLYKAFG